jgi:hypothetical protein
MLGTWKTITVRITFRLRSNYVQKAFDYVQVMQKLRKNYVIFSTFFSRPQDVHKISIYHFKNSSKSHVPLQNFTYFCDFLWLGSCARPNLQWCLWHDPRWAPPYYTCRYDLEGKMKSTCVCIMRTCDYFDYFRNHHEFGATRTIWAYILGLILIGIAILGSNLVYFI